MWDTGPYKARRRGLYASHNAIFHITRKEKAEVNKTEY